MVGLSQSKRIYAPCQRLAQSRSCDIILANAIQREVCGGAFCRNVFLILKNRCLGRRRYFLLLTFLFLHVMLGAVAVILG